MFDKRATQITYAILVGLVVLGAYAVLEPFGGALLSALVMAVTFYPFYQWLGHRFPHTSPSFRALVADVVVLISVVVPTALILWSLISESEALTPVLKQASSTVNKLQAGQLSDTAPWLARVRLWMAHTFGMSFAQFQEQFLGRITAGLGAISAAGTVLAQHVLLLLIHLVVMLFALFFFFRDGRWLHGRVEDLSPLPKEYTHELMERSHDTIVGVVRGWLLTSLVQAIVATIGYMIVGLEGAIFFGVLTGLIGLLPVVGTFGVWVPLAVFFLVRHQYWQGFFVLGWGALLVVGFIDTVARPYLVGRRAELPLVVLFFALLGGVEAFGAKGIILGPLIASLAPVLIDIYKRHYAPQHREVRRAS